MQARVSSRRVPGFASTGPAGDHESAAHSGDAGKPHWIDMTARSPPGAEPSAKGRTCSAGPAVIGARLPLACWRSRGYFQTKPIPHRGPVARDGPPGQGFAATGLAAASHRQVAISMAKPERDVGGPRRQRQKWRAYTGGHSEQGPFNGACARANVRQQPRSGFQLPYQ